MAYTKCNLTRMALLEAEHRAALAVLTVEATGSKGNWLAARKGWQAAVKAAEEADAG